MSQNKNYSNDKNTLENINSDEKYSITGESEFSRESTIPFDQDEVLSERHYTLGEMEKIGRSQSGSARINQNNERGRGPRGYRRSDETIKEDVSEALYRCTEVDASKIEVEVKLGKVTMKGLVDDINQKIAAENTIQNLAGIDEIFNDIRVFGLSSEKVKNSNKYGLIDNITGMN